VQLARNASAGKEVLRPAGQTSMEIEWCGTGTCVGTGNYVWITSTKK